MILYVAEDNAITLTGLTNRNTAAYVNDATVTYSLRTAASTSPGTGTELASGTLAYVAASSGNYRAVLESSAATLAPGTAYYLWVAVSSSTLNGTRRLRCVAQYRTEE